MKIGEKLRLNYDDSGIDIVDKINKALEEHGLWFQDDGEEHDGFRIQKIGQCAGYTTEWISAHGKRRGNQTAEEGF